MVTIYDGKNGREGEAELGLQDLKGRGKKNWDGLVEEEE